MSAPRVPADAAGIARAAEQVRSGGLIVYPTETVYGLGADPFDREALRRIFSAKGREAHRAILLLVRGEEDLDALVDRIPGPARALMAAFWPGPLTLIFPARPALPPELLGGGATVALRVSDAPVACALLARLGGPLTSTSANRSGNPPARSASEAAAELGDRVDLILDGGPSSPDARPSTLVDVSRPDITVLRQGPISEDAVRRVLDSVP